MPQKFLKLLKHAAHCGRRPRVFYDKQFRVGFTAILVFKNFQNQGQATGGRTPFYFSIALILSPIDCCNLIFQPQHNVLFNFSKFLQHVLNLQRLFSLSFSAFAVFSECSRLFSHFNFFKFFQKFSNLSLHDQILHQIWSQGGGACSGVTPNTLLQCAL